MSKPGSRSDKEDRTIRPPLARSEWLIVVLVVLLLLIGSIWALYRLIAPDSVNARNEFVRTVVQILGGGALLVGLYLARQTLEMNRRALQINVDTQQANQQAKRFTNAVEQLGSEKVAVRLGAIYALERLSKDSVTDYSTIMELLTAYVRERSPWEKPNETEDDTKARLNSPIGIDIQAVLTVIQRREKWFGYGEHTALDLRGTRLTKANLERANLDRVNFTGAHLEGASLRGAYLEGAILSGVHLEEADLTGAHLQSASLVEAHFERANLAGADLQRTNLREAHLEGTCFFEAHLEGADLRGAYLQSADFRGAYLEKVDLEGAYLAGVNLTRALGLERKQLRRARLSRETKFPPGLRSICLILSSGTSRLALVTIISAV